MIFRCRFFFCFFLFFLGGGLEEIGDGKATGPLRGDLHFGREGSCPMHGAVELFRHGRRASAARVAIFWLFFIGGAAAMPA